MIRAYIVTFKDGKTQVKVKVYASNETEARRLAVRKAKGFIVNVK